MEAEGTNCLKTLEEIAFSGPIFRPVTQAKYIHEQERNYAPPHHLHKVFVTSPGAGYIRRIEKLKEFLDHKYR